MRFVLASALVLVVATSALAQGKAKKKAPVADSKAKPVAPGADSTSRASAGTNSAQ